MRDESPNEDNREAKRSASSKNGGVSFPPTAKRTAVSGRGIAPHGDHSAISSAISMNFRLKEASRDRREIEQSADRENRADGVVAEIPPRAALG